jgi:hypothetical protein
MRNWRRILSTLVVAVPIAVWLYLLSKPLINATRFCSPDDEIYQVMKTNVAVWNKHFKTLAPNEPLVLRFQASWGKEFVIDASRWNKQGEVSPIFIQTIEAKQEPFGSSGYVYSANDSPQRDIRYRIDSMGDGIYCYRFK